MIPVRKEPLPWREIEGRVVIIQPQRGEVHELNPVAAFLWKKMDGQATSEELAQAVTEEFEVPLEEALADAREFFASLEGSQLIQWKQG